MSKNIECYKFLQKFFMKKLFFYHFNTYKYSIMSTVLIFFLHLFIFYFSSYCTSLYCYIMKLFFLFFGTFLYFHAILRLNKIFICTYFKNLINKYIKIKNNGLNILFVTLSFILLLLINNIK